MSETVLVLAECLPRGHQFRILLEQNNFDPILALNESAHNVAIQNNAHESYAVILDCDMQKAKEYIEELKRLNPNILIYQHAINAENIINTVDPENVIVAGPSSREYLVSLLLAKRSNQ